MAKRYVPITIFVIISFALMLAITLLFFTPVVEEATWGILPPAGQLIVGILVIAALSVTRYSRRRSVVGRIRAANRPRCPFYGFSRHSTIMVDQENQCALAGAGTPCAMEMADKTPNWDVCEKFNTQDSAFAISHILDSTRVFPREIRPHRRKPWSGIRAREWHRLVMS